MLSENPENNSERRLTIYGSTDDSERLGAAKKTEENRCDAAFSSEFHNRPVFLSVRY